MSLSDSSPLCFECGLCCNGVIFAKGQLEPGDDVDRLKQLGLRLVAASNRTAAGPKFRQPCSAFRDCRCGIYAERPKYCREFECLLLKNVNTGKTDRKEASRIVRLARKRIDAVNRLLGQLGESDGQTPLSTRFRRVKRKLESGIADNQTADRFAELSVAMHELNLLLGEAFVP
jgi:hypothetical protein